MLERRGLVLAVHDKVFVPLAGMVPRIRVRLTTAGRAAARAGQGITAPARPPHGLMTEWLWGTLARLYPAGEEGLPRDAPRGTPLAQRAPSWNALPGLQDRRDGPYMEEFQVRTGELVNPADTQHRTYQTEWRVRITSLGRAHYETHYACYRELYPAKDAAEPVSRPDAAHTGLADHRKRRPAGLVPEQQWRILAKLAELEQSGTCFEQAEQYRQAAQSTATAEARAEDARAEATRAREEADREVRQVRASADAELERIRTDAAREREELRQLLDDQIQMLREGRSEQRQRAERADA